MKIRELFETGTAGGTTSGNMQIGVAIPNVPVKAAKKKNGTVKNALDSNDNLFVGGSIVKRKPFKLSESELFDLLEAINLTKLADEGNWEVRVSNKPIVMPIVTGDKPQYVCQLKNTRRNITINGKGATRDEAIKDAKSHLKGETQDPEKFKSFTADLNVMFTKHYHSEKGEVPFFKFDRIDGDLYLIRASEEYYRNFGREIMTIGFSKATPRMVRLGDQATQLYGFPVKSKDMKRLGIEPNGRYVLDQGPVDSDGNDTFKMSYDSKTAGPSDKYRMGKPGVTVSATLQ